MATPRHAAGHMPDLHATTTTDDTPAPHTDETTPPAFIPAATGQAEEGSGYTPLFGDRTRTAVYIACTVAGLIGLACTSFGQPAIGGFISSAAGILAGAFGVAYNPVRLDNK